MKGTEGPGRRARALLHTWLGAYYALLLKGRGVEHIHVHHGYFASWIAMVASRLLGITFSMTLHGSDLLLHKAYLDSKLQTCSFCVTVSEFNRQYILEHFPNIRPDKVVVQHLGIASLVLDSNISATPSPASFVMLAAGRLHPIKDHAFLVRACRQLKARGLNCLCLIAGEGTERTRLERLIKDLDLRAEVELLGHLSRHRLDFYYQLADLVVLTSRSEGIPLVLMEAMARGKVVLAPNITGIPELVLDGKTGFLYRAGSLDDFVSRVEMVHEPTADLAAISSAARQHVSQYFDRDKNMAAFGDLFVGRTSRRAQNDFHENPILQQI
jgi:glycosyltransferase involved in cell wall biosynthesis